MGFQDKDLCQKLMRVLTLDEESIIPDPDLIYALLRMPNSSNIQVSHVNTSYGGFPLVQSLNIFELISGNPQQNTSAFGGNGKSGWNEQESPSNVEYPIPKEPIAPQLQWS